ncbi:MAG: 4Fe-4S dicluster domain-containing protein [Planctomycetes bacterium]|nr:4Fe-4S dicluster domain-containing protein [Planctomycetota bacterium]
MGLLTPQIDRDFTGGIYLPPLGDIPLLDHIEPVDYEDTLFLPLNIDDKTTMDLIVNKGQQVGWQSLLARAEGHYLYAPRASVVGEVVTEGAKSEFPNTDRAYQKVLTLKQIPDTHRDYMHMKSDYEQLTADRALGSAEVAVHPPDERRGLYRKRVVWDKIEQAGIVLTENGQPLAHWLKRLSHEKVKVVVANATPLEATLNGCLAILARWPEQVFVGLAFLKTWLGADQAIMAYPHGFNIDKSVAEQWQVKCVAVSEKYPQARSGSVLRSLKNQNQMGKWDQKKDRAVVFEIQVLRQVERAVLAGEMPTERIITINGDGVQRPGHFVAPLGMPLEVLLQKAQMYEDVACVVEGSSLAGIAVDARHALITPTSENYTIIRQIKRDPPHNCIRCGWCIADCPAEIDPMRLYKLGEVRQYNQAQKLSIQACMECGICSYICPSHLPIMEQIRIIKKAIKGQLDTK